LIWPEAIALLLVAHPLTKGDGEDDHIYVILNAKLYHHVYCLKANDKDMQFANGFAEEEDDVIFAF
jgi:hypothetical protein